MHKSIAVIHFLTVQCPDGIRTLDLLLLRQMRCHCITQELFYMVALSKNIILTNVNYVQRRSEKKFSTKF
jgi:hypothetical protein